MAFSAWGHGVVQIGFECPQAKGCRSLLHMVFVVASGLGNLQVAWGVCKWLGEYTIEMGREEGLQAIGGWGKCAHVA